MDTVAFLRRVLPERGIYVIARFTPGRKYPTHQLCDTVEEAAMFAAQYDAAGLPTFHGCGALREPFVWGEKDGKPVKQVRVQRNIRALRSFFMDLDVEPGNPKKFESHEAAIDGLLEFLAKTNLPMPMVVSSGGGIHIYWTLTHEIQPEEWRATAEGLKQLATRCEFKSDPACTSDPARVLRPVGTSNRKLAGVARPVELIEGGSGDVTFNHFRDHMLEQLRGFGIKPPDPVRQVALPAERVNQGLAVKTEFPPCSAHKVADRCAQLRAVRDTRGRVSEPHWYAGIQLLCHSIEGDALIHEWSSGHASYNREETDRKITQVRSQALGPTLCSTFGDRNPGACDGCPFLGKISSPVQLGTRVASAPAPVVQVHVGAVVVQTQLPSPPDPFTRGEKGGIYIEEEGITHKIYEHDLYPIECAWDEQLGYETTRWRHFLPQEGWKECTLRSALLARPVDFEAALRDNHIQPLIRNKIAMYGDAYLRKLRTETKMRRLFKAQGWKEDDTKFVLGDKLYGKGEVVQAGFSHGTEAFLSPFHSRGSIEPWKALTSALAQPGFEAHAFVLLLAFAAPLLKLAGRQGFTVNALGDSGIGKSTMAQFMCSVYSHPTAAWIGRIDTELARTQRIGAHAALPVYMDEATTIAPDKLRDLVYMIPTGQGRASMTRDYQLRQGAEWSTILVTSTNDSLQSKLQLEKQNAEAESLRLFEFKFPRVGSFGPIAKMIPAVLTENYGVAGPVYVQGLVEHRDVVKARLATIVEETERDFGMDDKERFWSQAVALALYGGALARGWGLIEFDPERLRPWLLYETRRMRGALADSHVGPVAIFAQYLDEHVGERLTITKLNTNLAGVNMRPARSLSQRYEKDSHTLYVARDHIKQYLDGNHFSFADVQDYLFRAGILVSATAKRTLGSGTDMAGGPVTCWRVKADHPELAGVIE